MSPRIARYGKPTGPQQHLTGEERATLFIAWKRARAKGYGAVEAATLVGTSFPTLYKWEARAKEAIGALVDTVADEDAPARLCDFLEIKLSEALARR